MSQLWTDILINIEWLWFLTITRKHTRKHKQAGKFQVSLVRLHVHVKYLFNKGYIFNISSSNIEVSQPINVHLICLWLPWLTFSLQNNSVPHILQISFVKLFCTQRTSRLNISQLRIKQWSNIVKYPVKNTVDIIPLTTRPLTSNRYIL